MSEVIERKDLAKRLLAWFKENHRTFPWREVRTPYHVLLSEILLHRTKAAQVVPVYNEFIKRFPTIDHLSTAPFSDVRKVVYPLGLNWRIKCLHQMAHEIMAKHKGKIPSGREELEMLPGISQYIASAVRCFAFGYPEVMLDTNTVRVLGRVFGMEIKDGSRRSAYFSELYESIMDKEHIREFNYAMIDLGALVCKPRDPLCDICPLMEMCVYARSGD